MKFIKLFTLMSILTISSFLWVFIEFCLAWAKDFNYTSLYAFFTFFISLLCLVGRELYIAYINRNN